VSATGTGLIRRLWLQRVVLLAALALMLVVMAVNRGALGLHGPALATLIALTAASVSWLAWVLVGPHGNSPLLLALTSCTAVSGGVLVVLYPSLAVYWFTFWACFSAGANFSPRAGVIITAVSAAILAGGYLDHQGTILGAFAAGVIVSYVFGRNRTESLRLVSRAAIEADSRERAATRAERERIARELHDVLGHSLASLSPQIESAAAALEATADAKSALSHLGRAAELIRSGQEEATAAVRTVRADEITVHTMVEGLVEAHRGAGGRARFTCTGGPRPLDAGRALALYRVTQEALTNAVKHASGAEADVQVSYDPASITVAVANELGAGNPDAPHGGHGVPGMRERMAAAGGGLIAGQSRGRWRVEARVDA
jgi:signal transduction histidine kinase